jgi:hypothetical protein
MTTVIRGSDNFDTSIGANVVQTHVTAPSTQTILATGSVDVTGLSATITPSSTASRVLVSVRWSGEFSVADHSFRLRLKRNGAYIGEASAAGSRVMGLSAINISYHGDDQSSTPTSTSFEYLDSPSSIGATTYVLDISSGTAADRTIYNNRTVDDTDSAGYERLTSSITLTEVQG